MSMITWIAEFYPTEARDCEAGRAIEHSLQKWRGLRPKELENHGMSVESSGFLAHPDSVKSFAISSDTCALCERFYDEDAYNACDKCPLALSRGGVSCDRRATTENNAPWWEWSDNNDPEPMIRALENALKDFGTTHD